MVLAHLGQESRIGFGVSFGVQATADEIVGAKRDHDQIGRKRPAVPYGQHGGRFGAVVPGHTDSGYGVQCHLSAQSTAQYRGETARGAGSVVPIAISAGNCGGISPISAGDRIADEFHASCDIWDRWMPDFGVHGFHINRTVPCLGVFQQSDSADTVIRD